MKNLKVGKKLFVSFGTLIAIFLVTIILSYAGIEKISKNYRDFYEENYLAEIYIYNLRLQMNLGVKNVALAAGTLDKDLTHTYSEKADKYMDGVEDIINWFKTSFSGDNSKVLEYEAMMTETSELRQQIINSEEENTKEGNDNAARLLEEYNQRIDEAGSIINEFAQDLSTQTTEKYKESQASKTFLVIIQSISVILAIIISIIMMIKLTRALLTPIKEIEYGIEKMQNGDFDFQIDYESQDELGHVADSMRNLLIGLNEMLKDQTYMMEEMSQGNFIVKSKNRDVYVGSFHVILDAMDQIKSRLSDAFSQIYYAAEQVASGSSQVSFGAQSLSQGSTEQASAIQELAATISEISNQLKDTAQISERSTKETLEIQKKANESNQNMLDMLNAMSDISTNSTEISKIVKTIEDIAFQTNILALNAAVEAARAGASGKGFAVVADEVRNLASKSAEASKSTSTLIEQSLVSVEKGKEITDKTAESLTKVIEDINIVMNSINHIADAASNQSYSVEQINIGIEQISTVVQTNSATSEESAASSEELSSQAYMLKELLNQFKWDEESNNSQYAVDKMF